jgi:quercetin dioxygenase-like cupin family protein
MAPAHGLRAAAMNPVADREWSMTVSTMGSKLKLVCVLVACVLGLAAWRVAWATAPSGFTLSNIVGPAVLDEFDTKTKADGYECRIGTKGASDVYVSNITIAVGGHGGWHSHPGPSIIAVKSGQATLYDDCVNAGAGIVYDAGTAFVEDAVCVHLIANEGSVPLELVVIQIVPTGAPRRIDESAPN